jgi:hypothetical protein
VRSTLPVRSRSKRMLSLRAYTQPAMMTMAPVHTHRGRSGNMPATVSTMLSLTRFGVKPSARAPGLSPPAPRT